MAFDKGLWKPNKRQEIFLSLPTSIFEALYGGGNASGKSDVLLVYSIIRGWYKNSKFKQVFMRRTHVELKNEIVPRSRELYPKFGATFNQTDMCWTFPRMDQFGSGYKNSGAMIFFGHCEEEKNVHIYDSMEINLFTPDEVTTFTEYIYTYIGFTRVRTNDKDLPAIIRAAGMPGGIGHSWTKKRFVSPAKEGEKIIIGKGNNKRIYIHSTVADNPYADQEYAQRLDGITNEAERKARKFGDWDAYQGQVFDDFRDKKYPDEPENALHVIPAFDIPDWWPRIFVLDWGYQALAYFMSIAISPQKRAYVYRELYWQRTKIADYAPVIKSFIELENPKLIKVCKSAGQDRGQEHTIQQQIEELLGRSVELSNNSPGSRVAGKALLHEYLRWKPKPIVPSSETLIYSEEYAQWIWRNKSKAEYESYLELFKPPEEETNIPKLQIFCCEADEHDGHINCCPLLIEAIKAASYDKPKKNKPAEDVAEWDGDDPYDTLRYGIDSVDNYFKTAEDEFKRIQKQEALMNALKTNGDMTAFYRTMRQIDTDRPMQVVARYKRR